MSQLRHHARSRERKSTSSPYAGPKRATSKQRAKLLVVSNLRLVVKIAMEYRRAWTNTLDLIQEGNVGLMEAVQRYDPYQGVKLSSYAVYWIRAYILKYILDNMRSVRLGTTRASRKLFFRLNKEKRELERQGYEAEPRLLAERLDVSEDDVIDMEARTLADLGKEFGVSRERVRQLEAKLVKRLRTYMEENLVDFEYYAPDQT